MGLVEAQRSEKRKRVVASQDVAWRCAASKSSAEQRVVVAALGSGMKDTAMWHVPHMILNIKKIKALLVSWSRIVNLPHGDFVLSGVSIKAIIPNLDTLGVKFDRKLTFEDHMRGLVSRVVKRIFVDTPVLLRSYFAFVPPILEYCSPVWRSAAECYHQLLESQVYSVARLCSDQSFLSLCPRTNVAGLSMLYKDNSNSNHSLFSELPYASTRVRHTRAAAAAHPLEIEVSRCKTSEFVKCFLPAQVCGVTFLALCLISECLMGSRVRDNRWLLPGVVFSSVFLRRRYVRGLRKQLRNNFVFHSWACAACFNNNIKIK